MTSMLIQLVLLIVGFVILIKGADFFVEGTSSIAKLLNVPTIIIGLTIVSMGTSAPEAAVSISAALKGQNSLSIANIIGSNMFNLLVVGGACAVLYPVVVKKSLLKREFPFSIIVTALLLFFLGNSIVLGNKEIMLSRIEGILLSALFIAFIVYMVVSAIKSNEEAEEDVKTLSPLLSIVYVVGGIIAVIYGGDLVVDSATEIALAVGMSENLVGLTIVAFGTSLPELVTSIVAAKKGENDMALGNIIGSNLFNILLILGMTASIHPIAVTMESIFDLAILLGVSIFTFLFARSKSEIEKKEGIVMLLMYATYTVYIFIR